MRKLIICFLLLVAPSLLAAPEGGQVAAGQAAISQAGLTTSINQLSDQAIINWQGFDIGVNELVQFLQPGANSVALNRIVGGDASQILGQLNANGRIFIVNPAGVVFGSTAQVDVGSLLATTLDITDENFLNGDFKFEKVEGAEASFIVNAGSIKVGDNGFAFLVAPSVDNQGLIVAKLGSVGLASGDTLTLDFRGDGLVTYAVSSEVAGQVSNSGSISGNQVVLGADTGADVLSGVVNNTGIIEATSLVERDGKVVLSGDLVRHAGSIAAQGGSVSIESTRQSLVTSDATIDVSGGASGDAGTVAILSDNRATFNGSIDARGGANGGDGGFVDVSSAGEVQINGIVDASAANGSTGTLLIDPKMITVSAAGTAIDPGVNNEFDLTAPGALTVIDVASINTQLADVLLQANTDITVDAAINIAAANIGITLQAGRSVIINQGITTNDGNVTIIANDPTATLINRDLGAATITIGAAVNSGAGDISLTIDATGHGDTAATLNLTNLTSSGTITADAAGDIGIGPAIAPGANLVLTADNDVLIGNPLLGGSLTINAGRTVDIGADIGGPAALNITANDPNAEATKRQAGPGGIIQQAGTIAADSVTLTVDATNAADGGGVSIDDIQSAGTVTITSVLGIGETAADDDVDIDADIISLSTSGTDAHIGDPSAGVDPIEVLAATEVNAATNDSAIALASPGADLPLGEIDAGITTVYLTAIDAGIIDATGAGNPNVTAGLLKIATKGPDGAGIGTDTDPIRTNIAMLDAETNNGGIYINETDGLLITSVKAKEQSQAGQVGAGPSIDPNRKIVVRTQGGEIVGSHDIDIQAGGDLIVETVSAPDAITLGSTGSIIDNNEDANNIFGRSVDLQGAAGVGLSADALDAIVETTDASSANGSVYLNVALPGSIGAITVGNGQDIVYQNSVGDVAIGELTAPGGTVTLDILGAGITDANGATNNVTADNFTVKTKEDVGSSTDAIETTVDTLTVELSGAGASLFIAESDGLSEISAKVNDGATNIVFAGGTFAFDPGTDVFSAAGVAKVTFANTGGDIVLNDVDASGDVSLTASGAILQQAGDITAANATLHAGTNIGTSGAPVETDITSTLIATADDGGVFINQTTALTATATALGADHDVEIATAAGDLTLVAVSATRDITLSAAGAILASDPSKRVVSGSSATLNAASIGTNAGTPLKISVATLDATSNAGGAFIDNNRALAADISATGGDISLSTFGNLNLGLASALGQTVTVVATNGNVLDNNAGALNVTADALNITAKAIGTDADAIETQVGSLTAVTQSGGVYIDDASATLVVENISTAGSSADVELSSAGSMEIKTISANGSDVTLTAAVGITDGNGTANNITAKKLTANSPGNIALDTLVDEIAAGGGGTVLVVNAKPVSVSESTLESGSATITAEEITILDLADNNAVIGGGASVKLVATKGDIVFLDAANDSIEVTGGATITLDASAGAGAVVVAANLKSAGGNIDILADNYITIHTVDAGTGDVSIISTNGVIVDGNGAANNVIANNLTISGALPSERTAELATILAIADAAATRSETDAKANSLEAFQASLSQAVISDGIAGSILGIAEENADAATAAVEAKEPVVLALQISSGVADGIALALNGAAVVAEIIAGPAQAIPQTGDGGAFGIKAALQATATIAEVAAFALGIAYDVENDKLNGLQHTEAELNADLFATQQTKTLAEGSVSGFEESVKITQASWNKAVIERDHSQVVAEQAVIAEDNFNILGTPGSPLGVDLSGSLNATAAGSDVYLDIDGPATINLTGDSLFLDINGGATLGDVTATNANNDASINIITTDDISVDGAVAADTLVRLESTTGAIVNGGGSITAAEFAAIAAGGVGNSGPLAISVDTFAASAGTGSVDVANDKALTVGTVAGVTGVTADGTVDIATSSPLTISQNVISDGAIALTAGDDANASGDDLTVNDGISVTSQAGVTLTAGDHVSLGAGSAVSGTDIAITANNDGDSGDAVAGGITAAGSINGNSVTLNGGSLNQTGVIGSTGIVDINSTGEVTVGADLTGTDVTIDGTAIAQSGVITASSLVVTGDSFNQTGNIVSTGIVDINSTGEVTVGADLTGTDVTIDGTAIAQSGVITASSLVVTGDSFNQTGNIVSTGIVDINSTGAVTQGADISGTDITIDGTDIVQTGNTTASTVDIGGDSLDQSGNIVSTGSVDISITGNILMSGDISGTTIDIDSSDFTHSGSIVATGRVDIDGDEIAIADIQAGGQTVAIVATGAITDNNDAARNVLASDLKLIGPTGIGTSADALETEVANLAANGGSGGVFVDNTGDLNLQTTDGQALLEAGGDIALSTTGNLNISNGFVQAAGFEVSLTATGGDIIEINSAADADIVADTINPVSTGAGNTIGTGADALELNAILLNASTEGGGIWIEDTAGGVSLGLVTTGAADNGTVIELVATGGSITDAASGDRAADIIGQTINLTASADVGATGERVEIDATTLNVDAASGSIWLEDVAGGVAVGLLTADTLLDLVATGGSIIEEGSDPDDDLIGATINLTVTDVARASSTIGESANRIEIDADVLNANTDGGSIWLEDSDEVAIGLVTTGGAAGSLIDLIVNGAVTDSADDPEADLVAEHIDLDLTSGTLGTGADAVELDASLLDILTAGGGIWVEDIAGGVAIGLVSTTGSSIVDILATDGSITDAASGDNTADVIGSDMSLRVTGVASTVGAAGERLEVDTDTLDVITEGGSIWLENTDGNVAIGQISTTGADGSIADLLFTNGGIIEDGSDGAADIEAETINIELTGNSNGIASDGARIEIDADILNVTTANGDISVTDIVGGVAVGLVTTGGSGNATTVNLTAVGGSITEHGDDPEADIIAATINAVVTNLPPREPSGSMFGSSANPLEIDADLLNISTDSGGVWLEDIAGGLDIGLITAPGAMVKILATGGAINGHGPDAADIIADTVDLTTTGAGNGIGIQFDAVNLNLLTEDGDISVHDTAGGVTLGLVSALGNEIDLSATGGSILAATPNDSSAELLADDIILESTGGSLGADASSLELDGVTLEAITDGGGIFLTDLAGGIAVNEVDATGSGTVKLHAVDGSIVEDGSDLSADITGDELHITVTGAASTIGTDAETLEIAGGTIRVATTEGGSIYLHDTAGGIAIDLVSTTGAAGSVIELSAASGSIVENPDADADLIAESVILDATGSGTIGTGSEAIEIMADNLSATTEGGSIWLVDLGGGIVIDQVSTGGAVGSVIDLTALNGSIVETEPGDAGPDLEADTVNLTVTGPNSTIGTATNALEIIANNIVLDGGDRIFLEPQNAPGPPPILSFGPNPPTIAILGGQVAGGADIHLYKQAITVLDPYNDIQLFIGSDPSFPSTGELILSFEEME